MIQVDQDPLVRAAAEARTRYQECEARYAAASEQEKAAVYEELWDLKFAWTEAVTALCRKSRGRVIDGCNSSNR